MAQKHKTTKKPGYKVATKPSGQFSRLVHRAFFARAYALSAVFVLLVSTIFWALLGARLQQGNADQLVDPYLFERAATFHGALFPAQHTFLLKWPVFWLIRLLGTSNEAFVIVTVGLTIVTVASLAACLYWIERRPLVFGTLCLALASTLLLVPAQPYAGGLLPVNMAMLATRNLEYVVYIASLLLFIRSPKLKSWRFWLAIVLMSVLIASDKLFLPLGIGAALAALVLYAFANRRHFVGLSVRWLLAMLLAGGGAILVLWLITASGLTHIASQAVTSPYGLIHNAKDFGLGSLYGLLGIATNFGANPAFDATIVRNIPNHIRTALLAPGGVTYIVNGLILLGGLFMAGQVLCGSFGRQRSAKDLKQDDATNLSIMLIWTTAAALAIFILTNHYYAVDSRYLTIAVFAVFIAAATYLRDRRWPAEKLVLIAVVIIIGMALGVATATGTYHHDEAALADMSRQNSAIAQTLAHHPVNFLMGDYWRVLPIKQVSAHALNVMPLAGCSTARQTLSSSTWQPNLSSSSFAYLLSLGPGLTDYPACSLNQVIAAYGKPNTSVLIAGTLDHPKELLLFYDHGANHSAPKLSPQTPSTVLPVALDQLPNTSCTGPTDMNIVAHQDDDLLFMNPDLAHSIQAGRCIRTVYVTAGDGGNDIFYWLGRERGSEAAYDSMDGPGQDVWVERIVRLPGEQFIDVANPRGNSKISLIFMHLPDGNINGRGFKASHFESLAHLEAGSITAIHSVDGQSTYTSNQLTTALAALMQTYQPTEIRTQASYVSHVYPDHSDHLTVGQYVQRAYRQYEAQQFDNQVVIPLTFYIGYPSRAFPENLSGQDLAQKEATFFAYAKFDTGVCGSLAKCQKIPTYNAYLHRQYQNPN